MSYLTLTWIMLFSKNISSNFCVVREAAAVAMPSALLLWGLPWVFARLGLVISAISYVQQLTFLC